MEPTSPSPVSPCCPVCFDARGTRERMDGPLITKAANAQAGPGALSFACPKCGFVLKERRTQRRSANDRFAGHAWLQPSGDLVVEDGWDHGLLAPEAVLRAVARNPEGFRIVYSDRAFHVSAGADKRAQDDPYIGFAPCECGGPPKRQRDV